MMDAYALVVAGGTGTRFGGDVPKQYRTVAGKEVLLYSLEAFERNEAIRGIVIVAKEEWHSHIAELCRANGIGKLISVAPAGKERRDSVRNGLDVFLQRDLVKDSVVLVHDAARPFLSEQVIDRNIAAAQMFGACNTVIPATDTPLVSKDGEKIDSMLPRREIYQSQTPQSFSMELLLMAHDTVPKDAPDVTDDCALVRAVGHDVHLVQGSPRLAKITRAMDLKLAELYLSEEEE